jgi:hypothetical protein
MVRRDLRGTPTAALLSSRNRFANSRGLGVKSVDVSCGCGRESILDSQPWNQAVMNKMD